MEARARVSRVIAEVTAFAPSAKAVLRLSEQPSGERPASSRAHASAARVNRARRSTSIRSSLVSGRSWLDNASAGTRSAFTKVTAFAATASRVCGLLLR